MKKTVKEPVYGADAGHVFVVTHSLQQQPVSDLSGKHARIDAFQVQDGLHDSGSRYFGFGASHYCWSDASCLIVSVKGSDF